MSSEVPRCGPLDGLCRERGQANSHERRRGKLSPRRFIWGMIEGNRFLRGSSITMGERIVVDPEILAGKPVVRGTRLAVEFVIDLLAQGWSESEILENYPGLSREDILACLAYASATLQAEKVYPVAV